MCGGGGRAGHAEGGPYSGGSDSLTAVVSGQDFRDGDTRADRVCGDGGAGPQGVLGLRPGHRPLLAVLVGEGRVVVGVYAHIVCVLHEVPLAPHLTGHTQRRLTGSLLLLIVTEVEKEGGRNRGRERNKEGETVKGDLGDWCCVVGVVLLSVVCVFML